ncbi:putative cyclin-d6-1 [Phtheirospermum japonicum]|uniref:Putative cyclin-d6-1 n=1 Tax=Phtheirospermum japonicum TaxID=374723 RepID=A0A830B6P0_9LAMI|nr:putative cyclin-d6-1 [Phtheirospermum japonicum]
MRERDILYSTEDVLRMELAICRGWEWRMRTVTPFLFVGFFIPFLELPLAHSSVHDLIYKSQRDIEFTQYLLSVIAASAMLAVSSGIRNKPSISCKVLLEESFGWEIQQNSAADGIYFDENDEYAPVVEILDDAECKEREQHWMFFVSHTVIPLQHLVSFSLNIVSRAFEFKADAFAKKLGYAAPLRARLMKLQVMCPF